MLVENGRFPLRYLSRSEGTYRNYRKYACANGETISYASPLRWSVVAVSVGNSRPSSVLAYFRTKQEASLYAERYTRMAQPKFRRYLVRPT